MRPYIKTIAAQNFMGATFTSDMGPFTVIAGDSATGKSTRLLASQFALSGYIPAVGKANAPMYRRYATGATMGARVNLSNGIEITRSLTKKKSVALESKFIGTTEAEWQFPGILLNPGEYFGLSERDRVSMVFGMVDLSASKTNAVTLTSKLKEWKSEEPNQHHAEFVTQICGEVTNGWESLGRTETTLQDWLEEMIATYTTQAQEARAAVKRMEGTTAGLTEIKAQQDATLAPKNVEGELAAAKKELTTLAGKVGELESQLRTLKANATRKENLEKELAAWVNKGAELTALEVAMAALTAKIATAPDYVTLARTERAIMDGANTARDMLQSGFDSLTAQIEELKEDHAKAIGDKKFPCAKCKKQLTANHNAKLDDLKERLAKLNTSLVQAGQVASDAIKAYTAAVQKMDTHLADQQDLANKRPDAIDLRNHQARKAGLDNELAALRTLGDVGELTQKFNEAVAARDAKQTAVGQLQARQNQFIVHNSSQASKQTAEDNWKKNVAELEVVTAFLDILRTEQAALVASAFAPILATANELAATVLNAPLELKDGEIGVHRKGHWVLHESFSGTEKAVAYAAISIALAVTAPIKLLMLDEVLVGKRMKVRLVNLVKDLLKKGVIDQCIWIDVDTSHCDDEMTVLHVDGQGYTL